MINTVERYLENPRDWITFGGRPLTDFKVYCNGDKTFSAPKRNTESISIPGRNGTLERDLGSFSDITVEYSCWIATNFRAHIEGLRNYLLSQKGSTRLEDTYDPDTFRLASFQGPLDVSGYYGSTFGSFTLQFQARPERFLKSGEKEITVNNGITDILNPTMFTAKPIIEVCCGPDASLTIGDKSITVVEDVNQMFIDTENLNAYGPNDENLNYCIDANDKSNWVNLAPGENRISASGFTYIKIIPRWWIL